MGKILIATETTKYQDIKLAKKKKSAKPSWRKLQSLLKEVKEVLNKYTLSVDRKAKYYQYVHSPQTSL